MNNFKEPPKRPRLQKEEYIGSKKYFITITTHERKKYFTQRNNCLFVYKQFLRSLKENNFKAFVYYFIPDHLHLLVEAQDENCNLQKFVKSFKQSSGFYFKKGTGFKLWSKSYYDHVLRSNEYVENIIWYILNNAVRKKLVKNWYEYKYWGSTIYKKEHFIYG